jgi:hypothetical protein
MALDELLRVRWKLSAIAAHLLATWTCGRGCLGGAECRPQRARSWLVGAGLRLAVALSMLAAAAPIPAAPGSASLGARRAASATPYLNTGQPSFRVAGIIVGPHTKLVQVIVPDASGRGGRALTLKEGAIVEGFLIKKIERRQIYVEKDGSEIRLGLGNPRPLQEPPALEEKGRAHGATAPGGTASRSPAEASHREPAGAGRPPEPPPHAGDAGVTGAPRQANGG